MIVQHFSSINWKMQNLVKIQGEVIKQCSIKIKYKAMMNNKNSPNIKGKQNSIKIKNKN